MHLYCISHTCSEISCIKKMPNNQTKQQHSKMHNFLCSPKFQILASDTKSSLEALSILDCLSSPPTLAPSPHRSISFHTKSFIVETSTLLYRLCFSNHRVVCYFELVDHQIPPNLRFSSCTFQYSIGIFMFSSLSCFLLLFCCSQPSCNNCTVR